MDFFTYESLKKLVDNCITNSTATGIDHMSYNQFTENIDTILRKMVRDVNNDRYKYTRYKELLLIKDRFSVPRCISIPTLRDRLCLKEIQDLLKYFYRNEPEIVSPPLPQQSVANVFHNINKSQYTAFIKLDISRFFDSINHYRLFNLLAKKGIPIKEINLIKTAVKNPTYPISKKDYLKVGIPQGLPISNILSQIYMYDLVTKMQERFKNIFITRYVDDVIILCKIKDVQIIQNFFVDLIEENYTLSINKKKIKSGKLLNTEFEFLGYRFFPKRDQFGKKVTYLSVRTKSVKRLQERLIRIMVHYKKVLKENNSSVTMSRLKFELNVTISGSISTEKNELKTKKRYGWLFFFSQINDYSVLYSLDAFLRKKIRHIFPEIEESQLNGVHNFVSSYRDVRFHSLDSINIFYPDRFSSSEQRELLSNTFGLRVSSEITDQELERIFRSKIFKLLKKNEKDLADFS